MTGLAIKLNVLGGLNKPSRFLSSSASLGTLESWVLSAPLLNSLFLNQLMNVCVLGVPGIGGAGQQPVMFLFSRKTSERRGEALHIRMSLMSQWSNELVYPKHLPFISAEGWGGRRERSLLLTWNNPLTIRPFP